MSPAPPASLSTLPEHGAGTSTTAFAVSIETSGSSSRTVSPTLTCHSTISASGRPSPRSGSRNTFFSLMRSSVWHFEVARGQPALRAARVLAPPPAAGLLDQPDFRACARVEFARAVVARRAGGAVIGVEPAFVHPAAASGGIGGPEELRPFAVARADRDRFAAREAHRVGVLAAVVAHEPG